MTIVFLCILDGEIKVTQADQIGSRDEGRVGDIDQILKLLRRTGRHQLLHYLSSARFVVGIVRGDRPKAQEPVCTDKHRRALV